MEPDVDRIRKWGDVGAKKKSTEILQEFMKDLMMTDIWRDRHPGIEHFTWRRRKPRFVASRLDFFLIDTSMANWVECIEIKPSIKSDHSAVFMEFFPYSIKRGKGVWKLNNNLLQEKDYVDKINRVITELEYKGKHLNACEFWEVLLLEIIEASRVYAIQRAGLRKLIVSQLEDKIEKMEKMVDLHKAEDSIEVSLLDRSKLDLEKFKEEQTRGAILRSKCTWYNEASKPTKYFLNLEKNRSGTKNMSVLLTEKNELIKDPKKIIIEQLDFYEKLYLSDGEISFEYVKDTGICISEIEIENLDQILTVQELTTALKEFKRNKAPGLNRLTSEFFMVFWEKLKHRLYKAYLQSYEDGIMYDSATTMAIYLNSDK